MFESCSHSVQQETKNFNLMFPLFLNTSPYFLFLYLKPFLYVNNFIPFNICTCTGTGEMSLVLKEGGDCSESKVLLLGGGRGVSKDAV